MSDNPLTYLFHIRDESRFILSLHEGGLTYDKLIEDETIKRALVRSIEIIGEASKQIPLEFKLKWDKIEWKKIAGMRDRLIHDYMGVNYHIVWDVAVNKIPALLAQIEEVLELEQQNPQ